MLAMAEFWVAVAFVVFLAILVYYKVPALIAKALDDRAEAIRKELDEARRLREEAQNLLADYQKKHRNVGQEAEAIVEQARREAEALAQETRASLKTHAGAAHQARRGQDRPRRGAGGRRGARRCHRHGGGGGREDPAREDGRRRRRRAHRPEHPRPQGPAELTAGASGRQLPAPDQAASGTPEGARLFSSLASVGSSRLAVTA